MGVKQGKPRKKNKQGDVAPKPGPPEPASGPSGRERVQKKLDRTTAPIPFQRVDWPTRTQYLKRLTQLRIERSSWLEHWMDLSWFCLPRQSRFTTTDRNLGYRKDRLIINSRATKDLRTMAAGMMSGISSPARPWFKLTTRDPDLAQFESVKEWLGLVEDRIRVAFAKSNIYRAFHTMYLDLGLYGTAAAVIEADEKDMLRAYVQPVGAYMLAQDGSCRVDTLYRELSLNIGQLVDRFGLENCSNWVQWNYRKGNYDIWTYIIHVIEPNRVIDNVRWEAKFKAIRSAWFELGAFSGSTGYDTSDSGYSGEPLNFLLESGYEESPIITPRWQTTGMEDAYGSSPGMDCLGDIRSLQSLEKAKAKLVAKLADPPMKGPASMKVGKASLVAGDFTPVDDTAANAKFEPAQIVDPRGLEALYEDVKAHEQRIDASLFVDVWQMFQSGQEDPQKTATEIAALKEEKLQILGPILENVHGEMLGPTIHRAFNILWRAGQIPKPPPELAGQDMDVEYISTAAQAQRAIGVQALQSLVSFTTAIAEAGRPDAWDNVDVDEVVESFGDKVGADPKAILPKEQVQAIRQQRAQQQAAQAQAEQAAQQAKAARDLSAADTSGDNGLTRLLDGMGQAA